MIRQIPAAGMKAAFRWQRTHRQTLLIDHVWMKYLKFSTKTQDPIDEPHSERAANVWLSYLGHANKIDRDRVEIWKGKMDRILIFSGLFSAIVTSTLHRGGTSPSNRTKRKSQRTSSCAS
ncbi:hypothetical protein OF83DRAFT_628109 [Amylostereum chailletii]|nr:hypothetical protein OF83DRAFT_628109 [Amylostereum chailletii]